MRKTVAVIVAIAAFIPTGCKSKEQKIEDLNAAYQTANAQYQKDCSTSPSADDGTAILGAALGNKPSPQQQAAIDQRQREADARKNSPHCKELDNKRDDLARKMLAAQKQ
ncbi:MAG: hypothetical protein ACYCSN_19075 [Acidobacteriaceae bacterium]